MDIYLAFLLISRKPSFIAQPLPPRPMPRAQRVNNRGLSRITEDFLWQSLFLISDF
jgi:hypothetical protein